MTPTKTIITADGKVINVVETANLEPEQIKEMVNNFKELGIVFGVHEYKRLYTLEEMRDAYDAGMANIDCDGCHIDPVDEDFNDLIKELN